MIARVDRYPYPDSGEYWVMRTNESTCEMTSLEIVRELVRSGDPIPDCMACELVLGNPKVEGSVEIASKVLKGPPIYAMMPERFAKEFTRCSRVSVYTKYDQVFAICDGTGHLFKNGVHLQTFYARHSLMHMWPETYNFTLRTDIENALRNTVEPTGNFYLIRRG